MTATGSIPRFGMYVRKFRMYVRKLQIYILSLRTEPESDKEAGRNAHEAEGNHHPANGRLQEMATRPRRGHKKKGRRDGNPNSHRPVAHGTSIARL